jgi:hypothetical protein
MDELELSDIYLSPQNAANDIEQDDNKPAGLFGLKYLMNNAKTDNFKQQNVNADDFDKELEDITTKTTVQFKPDEDNNNSYNNWFNSPQTQQQPPTQIHHHPEKEKEAQSNSTMQKKKQLLIKLAKMKKMGIEVSQNYTMENTYEEIQTEFSAHYDERKREEGIKFQRDTLITVMPAIEFFNNNWNPFGIDLDGLTEATRENINSYDDIFEELYDKYKPDIAVMPELRLVYAIARSAAEISFTNAMIKRDAPALADVLKNRPDLAQQLHSASLNTMHNQTQQTSQTASFLSQFFPQQTQQSQPQPQPLQTPLPRMDPNIEIKRPEMNGPSDISHIISSIKTTQNQNQNPTFQMPIQQQHQVQMQQPIQPVKKVRRKKSEKVAKSLGLTPIENTSF